MAQILISHLTVLTLEDGIVIHRRQRADSDITSEYAFISTSCASYWSYSPQSEAVDNNKTSGLVFGAASVDEELFFAHAGPRVFGDSSSGPLTDDSLFWICSQTKLIVSVCSC